MSQRRDAAADDSAEREDEQGDRWVAVSSGLVLARLDWDIMMHRVLMVLMSQLDPKRDTEFRLQRVPVRSIGTLARVRQKSIHQEVARAAAKLVRAFVGFWNPETSGFDAAPLFSMCTYKTTRGVLEAKFSDKMRAHLLQMGERGARYRLREAMVLSTPYAIRAYEIAKLIEQSNSRPTRRLPVGQFRRMLKLENKYPRHCDMRRRVIVPAVREVNEKTDLALRCDDVREGQTPVALAWHVASGG